MQGRVVNGCSPELIFASWLLCVLGACSILIAISVVRDAVLGRALRKECAGDRASAWRHIKNVRAENDLFESAVLEGMAPELRIVENGKPLRFEDRQ
jgi:hypothetical protein